MIKVKFVALLCLVDRRFLDGLRHENLFFTLIPKYSGKPEVENYTIHNKEVVELLTEYEDIISKNVPDCLPPVWSIIHHIDLILATSLHNKEAHRMTPVENVKLN